MAMERSGLLINAVAGAPGAQAAGHVLRGQARLFRAGMEGRRVVARGWEKRVAWRSLGCRTRGRFDGGQILPR